MTPRNYQRQQVNTLTYLTVASCCHRPRHAVAYLSEAANPLNRYEMPYPDLPARAPWIVSSTKHAQLRVCGGWHASC